MQSLDTMNKKEKAFTGKIAAAIIEKNGKYFIAQRAKESFEGGLWEFPGGKQEDGETIQECLQRELCEEFGVIAKVGEYVCSSFFQHKGKETELLAFKIESFDGTFECKEHQEIRWVLPEQLSNYAFPDPDLNIITAIQKNHKK